ncbi:hypothetical protein LUZ60_016158 [Juncus effusus]|nr:hypothetical protein LUZ60_016158 [Juncus effusus]
MATCISSKTLTLRFGMNKNPGSRFPLLLSANKVQRKPGSLLMTMSSQEKENSSIEVANESSMIPQEKQRIWRSPTYEISPFEGLVDAYFEMRSVRQMLETVDTFLDETMSFPGVLSEARTPWELQEDEFNFKMRFDVPGLSKEELKVSLEDDELVINGEPNNEEGEEFGRRESVYEMRVELPDEADKDNVKAKLKNGVLVVNIPKRKMDRNVVHVEVN